MEYIFISDEDYEVGLSNGLSKKLVYQRVMTNGWSVEKAISTPVPPKVEGLWKKWGPKSQVSRSTFHQRVQRGQAPEQAILVQKIQLATPKFNRIPESVYERAAENGISRNMVYYRVNKYLWSHEEASTTPPLKVNERKKRGGWR